jgi:hypothetical protein
MNITPAKHINGNSTILYGVPRVEYGASGCTPFPMCVKACANYLGQDVSYDFVMAASSAAFRLTWDTTSWNGGNVDTIFTFDDPLKVYKVGIESLGREFNLLGRNGSPKCKKGDFIGFIKEQINKGYPCIALGVIGPQEACIITGYRDDGQTLLGWNFFQDSPEFANGVEIDESGYFISRNWWQNSNTVAVMSMGDNVLPMNGAKEILQNAIEVLTGRKWKKYAKGILAYDAWKKAISDETQFPENAILPILAERLMCHGDAMDCLADGRHNAASYMGKLAEDLPEYKDLCTQAKVNFSKVSSCIWNMADVLGGYARNEEQMRNLSKPEVRHQLCSLIDKCKTADEKALEAIEALYTIL